MKQSLLLFLQYGSATNVTIPIVFLLLLIIQMSCVSSLKSLGLHSVIYSSTFFGGLLETATILQSLFLIPENLQSGFFTFMWTD